MHTGSVINIWNTECWAAAVWAGSCHSRIFVGRLGWVCLEIGSGRVGFKKIGPIDTLIASVIWAPIIVMTWHNKNWQGTRCGVVARWWELWHGKLLSFEVTFEGVKWWWDSDSSRHWFLIGGQSGTCCQMNLEILTVLIVLNGSWKQFSLAATSILYSIPLQYRSTVQYSRYRIPQHHALFGVCHPNAVSIVKDSSNSEHSSHDTQQYCRVHTHQPTSYNGAALSPAAAASSPTATNYVAMATEQLQHQSRP